uniref:Uncharacterized protein n=1 Tax=Thermogemmatispora argillosa TaxID=2045280 RepID=A0A455T134_9CHLR|nr:hypothetical protein KTA_12700 [Thermogemmatispora argillosa]
MASGRACRPYGSLGDDPLAVRVLTPRFERAEREFLPARIRRRLVRFLRSQATDTHPAAAPGPPDSQQADSLSDLYGGFRLFS